MYKPETKEGIIPKQFFPDARYIIVYAFSIGTRHFFRYDDVLNNPYDRALKCMVYYKEMDMNCDRAFIKAHTEAIDNMLVKGKFTINDLLTVKTLNDQLKQRLELPKEPDLLYKLASVVYFDQFENPMVYEFKYGEEKIKYWKENSSITDFFLQKPLQELIPYLDFAGENLETFSRMAQATTKQQLDKLLPLLSEEQKMTLLGKLSLSPAP